MTTAKIMFPPSRWVSGSFFDLVTKSDKGQPLPESQHHWSYGIAIPKNGTTEWKTQTDWGRMIVATAAADWPNGETNHPAFSFKVKDGDSAHSAKPGQKAPRDHEGWPGHWVVFFRRGKSIGEVPLVNANGSENFALRAQKQVKKGDFIQVYGSVKGSNSRTDSPGCYVNDEVIAFVAKGDPIVSANRPDPTKLGFGGALPVGAQAVPTGAQQSQSAVGSAVDYGSRQGSTGGTATTPNTVTMTAVQPNPAFLTPGVPAVAPAAPSAPHAAPVRQMTAKAGGLTYEQFKVADPNWTDELLRQHGYMV